MEITSTLLNSKIFSTLKDSLIAVSEVDHKEKWRVSMVEYINTKAYQEKNKFFYDMVPSICFTFDSDAKCEVACTDEDGIIWMKAPNQHIGDSIRKWDFIFCHECLHQLWETFKVRDKIIQDSGSYNHNILNVASDCVINDYLSRCLKKEAPDMLITPEYLEKTFNVKYDFRQDTQLSLYYKLLKVADEVKKDKRCQAADDFNGTIDPKSVNQSDGGPQPPQPPQGDFSDDYVKGWTQGIKDVLDKKVDPLSYKPSKAKNDYDQGYNDVIAQIKEGMENGIDISSDNSGSSSEGSNLPQIPWNMPKQQNQQGGQGGQSSPSQSAQSSADSAKDAASEAQKTADKMKKEAEEAVKNNASDSTSKSKQAQDAQNAANDAKKAASDAQAAADKAKQAEKDGDMKSAKDSANDAADSQNKAQSASEKIKTPSENSTSASSAAKDAQTYADAIKDIVKKLKKATENAKNSGNKSKAKALADDLKNAEECAEEAQKAADKAKDAADKAKSAAKNGNPDEAKKAAQDAIDQATKAKRELNKSMPSQPDTEGFSSNASDSSQGSGGAGYNPNKDSGFGNAYQISKEDRKKLRERNEATRKKYIGKITGDFGEFLKKCQSASQLQKNGIEINVPKGTHGWNQKLEAEICTYVESVVQEYNRRYKKTYQKTYRRAGYVKPGDFIQPGKKVIDERLIVNPTFYVDISGSMGGKLDNVWEAVYTIGDGLVEEFGDMSVVEDVKFKLNIFNDDITEIKWGTRVSDRGCTLPFEDLLEDISKSDESSLLVIVITDAQFPGINEQKVEKFIKDVKGMIFFVTNENNEIIKNLAKKYPLKLYYNLVPYDFKLN